MAQVLDTTISSTHRVRDVRESFIVQIGMETPVSSRLKKAPKPMSSTPEWPVKTFATAVTTGVIEGAATTSASDENNLANKTMLASRFQRIQRQPAASHSSKALGSPL